MDYTPDFDLITSTIRMRVSNEEMHLRRTKTGEDVKIIEFKGLGFEEVKNLREYFFKTGVLINNPKSDSPVPFYSQIAIKDSDFNKISKIAERYPDLKNYLNHLLFIAGYATNSGLGVSKKTDALRNKETNFNPALKEYLNYDHLLNAKEELDKIKKLFKLINQTYPNPEHKPLWEGDEAESINSYQIDEVYIKLKNSKSAAIQKPIKFLPLSKNRTINFFDDILWGFELYLESENLTIEDWYYSRYGFMLPPRNRPDKLHHAFCQQFVKYFDEKTKFTTKQDDYSQNNLLHVFVEIYKICEYKLEKTNDEVDLVRKWLV